MSPTVSACKRRGGARPGEGHLAHVRHVEQAGGLRACGGARPGCRPGTGSAASSRRTAPCARPGARAARRAGWLWAAAAVRRGGFRWALSGSAAVARLACRNARPVKSRPPLSRNLRDSGLAPLLRRCGGASRRRPAFQRFAPKRGPLCLSVSGGRLRLRRQGDRPALSRTGDVRTGGRMVARAALCNRHRDHVIADPRSGGCRRVRPPSAGSRHRGGRRRRSWSW